MTRILRGVAISPGVGRGKAVLLAAQVVAVPLKLSKEDVQEEIRRFHQALAQSKKQLKEIRDHLARMLGKGHALILDAQLHLLDDPAIVRAVRERIASQHINAEWALELVLRELHQKFQAISDTYLQERWSDVRDVIRRVQSNLMGTRHEPVLEPGEAAVLVTDELAPSDLIELTRQLQVRGIVLTQASPTSHVAILSRSMGIPAVASIDNVLDQVSSGQDVLVDGYDGIVIVAPTPLQIREYEGKRRYFKHHLRLLIEASRGPARTLDGYPVSLMANIEFVEECSRAITYGAEGIGLFRSEYLYLKTPNRLPTEEEHYEVYRRLVELMAPRPVVVRTADLGADKVPSVWRDFHPREPNPALGLRAVRLALKKQEIWEAQLAAMLRAAAHGDLRILVPFVATVEEVLEFLDMLEEVRQRLRRSGATFRPDPPVGIMVEIPSMARLVRHLEGLVQFISIGTNDLIQFMLAVDRDHEGLRYLYKPYNPAFLKTLVEAIEQARAVGLDVTICGEMAWDIPSVPLLVGMGCPTLSMGPQWIPAVRFFIQEIRYADARKLLERALEMRMGMEVEEMLLEWIQRHFPEGIYHPLLRASVPEAADVASAPTPDGETYEWERH